MSADEWRRNERLRGAQGTEHEWLTCPAADSLLTRVLERQPSDRKLRLFGCACCRLIWHYLIHPECKASVEASERFADNEISAEEMRAAAQSALALFPKGNRPHNSESTREKYLEYASAISAIEVARSEDEGGWPYWERLVDIPDAALNVARYQRLGLDQETMEATLCDRLREIVGNPFRPVAVNPAWRTSDVILLANSIYDKRAFDRLPILADALQDAGCHNADILSHFRDPNATHVRGCWALDLVLGKE